MLVLTQMNNKIKRQLISYARRLSISWAPRVAAKKEAQVAPATFECAKCGNWSYEGSSEKNYQKLCEENPDKVILFAAPHMDHIVPVIDPKEGHQGWDEYYKRLFCEKINYRCLCQKCHDTKTSAEDKVRNIYFNGKKPKRKTK